MKIRIQKNEMAAKTGYDFRRLEEEYFWFLPCKIEEEKEAVSMSFELEGMKSFEELKDEIFHVKLVVLSMVAKLEELYQKYDFSLDPGNLYYNMYGHVKVARRDIVSDDRKNGTERFLREYKALVGYVLEEKGTYEDYLYSSPELLCSCRGEEFVKLMEAKTAKEEGEALSDYFNRSLEVDRNTTIQIGRKKYKRLLRWRAAALVLLAVLMTAGVYTLMRYVMGRTDA